MKQETSGLHVDLELIKVRLDWFPRRQISAVALQTILTKQIIFSF